MSFGYSIGDFIAGANLSYRLIRALSETQGANLEYQGAIAEHAALQQTFLQVSQLRASETLAQATINGASEIVMSSMELIGAFLAKTQRYRERLCGRGHGNKVSDSWQKMGWVLFKNEELRRLTDKLHLKLSHISLLLATAQIQVNVPACIASYKENEFEGSSPTPPHESQKTKSNAKSSHIKWSQNDSGIISAQHGISTSQTPTDRHDSREVEAEKKLLAHDKRMMAQKADYLKYRKDLAARDAAEQVAARGAAELAALKKDLEEVKEKALAKGAQTGRKEMQAELEKARGDAIVATAKGAGMRRLIALNKFEPRAAGAVKEKKKKSITVEDPLGRTFIFPFDLCAKWEGIDKLIKQAFWNIDVLGREVIGGRYDLIDPNGGIILPQLWESIVEPGWSITMQMWPKSEHQIPSYYKPDRNYLAF